MARRSDLKNNVYALKHGGEASVKAIQQKLPFTGLAAQAETGVLADLEAEGRAVMISELAIRLHTASRLYWAAVVSLADKAKDDDQALKRFDTYISRFGWLAGAALRAWAQHRDETKDTPTDALLIDAMSAASKGIDDVTE